jgi:hypothetical protein
MAPHSRCDLSLAAPSRMRADHIERDAKLIFRRDDFSQFGKRKNPKMKVSPDQTNRLRR